MRQRPATHTRYPSPAAQRRAAELWKARLGLASAVIITVFSLVVMYRIAGVGVQTMLTVTQNALTTVQGLGIGLGLPLPEGLSTLLISPAPAAESPAPAPADIRAADSTTPQPTRPPSPTSASVAVDAPSTSSTVVPGPPPQPTATLVPGSVRQHAVEAGDTLFALARRYESSVQAIVAANNLRDSNVTLRVGQQLIVP
ncbi:MAG: hypothetical protein CL878_08150 [Dehalococcoidia bacterium]|nr:hypothetical protein [Dehalococcoidia bacterium]